MKGKNIRKYVNDKGNDVYVYVLKCSEKEQEEYEGAQGEFYREDEEGKPLWFSPDFHGDVIKVGITSKGKIFADTSEMDKIASLSKKYEGTELGTQLAKAGADKMLADLLGGSFKPSAPTAKEPESTEKSEDGEVDKF